METRISTYILLVLTLELYIGDAIMNAYLKLNCSILMFLAIFVFYFSVAVYVSKQMKNKFKENYGIAIKLEAACPAIMLTGMVCSLCSEQYPIGSGIVIVAVFILLSLLAFYSEKTIKASYKEEPITKGENR